MASNAKSVPKSTEKPVKEKVSAKKKSTPKNPNTGKENAKEDRKPKPVEAKGKKQPDTDQNHHHPRKVVTPLKSSAVPRVSPPKEQPKKVRATPDREAGRHSDPLSDSKGLDARLKGRLDQLKMKRKEVSKNAASVNKITDVILTYLKSLEPRSKWGKVTSGSYYEKTKIRHPDEYDCMFACEMRAKVEYGETGDSAVFCSLRSLTANPGQAQLPVFYQSLLTDPQANGSVYICPLRFRNHFSSMAQTAIQREKPDKLKDFEIVLVMESLSSPAVTFKVQQMGSEPRESFSFDVVPAVKLYEWPNPAKRWTCRWKPELEEQLKHPDTSDVHPYVVAKIHPKEMQKAKSGGQCLLWRISFSAAEKQIMKRMKEPSGKVCRKDILKLLKSDLEDFKLNNTASSGGGHLGFCSYCLKMIFLQLLDEKPDEEFWTRDNVRRCYAFALRKVVDCMKDERVPNYFIRSANALDMKGVLKGKYGALVKYFESQQEIYSAGLKII